MPTVSYKKRIRYFLFLLLTAYAVMQVYCLNKLSINYDEPLFASYGISVLKLEANKDVEKFDSKLPAVALNMLPRAFEQLFNPELKKSGADWEKDILAGRYISLLAAVVLGILIFRWSSEIYNEQTAIIVLLFYLLNPDLLAHGIFVTTDIFAALFLTSSLFFLWKYRKSGQTRHFILSTLSVALGQITKFSLVHLFFLIPILLFITIRRNPTQKKSINPWWLFLIFIFINWFVISLSHFFYHEFYLLSNYHFRSELFRNVQSFFGSAASYIPVPLPESYLLSMDLVINADRLGGGVPGSLNAAPYILGETSRYGFWYYYFVSLFYKLPVSTLLIWLSGLLFLAIRFDKKIFYSNYVFLFIPALYYLVYFNFFYTTHVGIRHIIIIYPLLFILSGKLIHWLFEKGCQFILHLLLIFQVISVARYFPHFLPYTNEFILNKKYAYKKIADSNLCYGEGKQFLQHYLLQHPNIKPAPGLPAEGLFFVEVNDFLNLKQVSSGKYTWLKDLKPIADVHTQYLIFEVSREEAESIIKAREN